MCEVNDSSGWLVHYRDGKTTVSHNGIEVMATKISIDFCEDGQSHMTICVRLTSEDVVDAIFSEEESTAEQPRQRYLRNPGMATAIASTGSTLDKTIYWCVETEASVVEIFDFLVEDSSYNSDINFNDVEDSVERLTEAGFLWKLKF
jgi:hypothetical protein